MALPRRTDWLPVAARAENPRSPTKLTRWMITPLLKAPSATNAARRR